MTPPSKTATQSEAEVSSWGFKRVVTWSDEPNAYYSPHSHAGLTTHLILKGTMTVLLPREPGATKKTFGVGDRVDIGAGVSHEVWIGGEGATMVIGE